jgi:hypothetical protein
VSHRAGPPGNATENLTTPRFRQCFSRLINRAIWDQSRRLRVQLIAFGESLPVVDILAQRIHSRRDQRVTLETEPKPSNLRSSTTKSRVDDFVENGMKAVSAVGVLLLGGIAYAYGAGVGAAGAAGAGAAHATARGSSFGRPGVANNPFPGVTARPGCVGGIAGATSTGSPAPNAPPSLTSPSSANGSAVKGPLQSTPDLPRLTQQDQRLLREIKYADDRLGRVGNPKVGDKRASGEPGMAGTSQDLRRETNLPRRSSMPPPTQEAPVEASTDRASLHGKSDVSRLRERDQQLAREIKRETDKLGEVGNPGSHSTGSQVQGDYQAGTGGESRGVPHRPLNTMGAASGSAC